MNSSGRMSIIKLPSVCGIEDLEGVRGGILAVLSRRVAPSAGGAAFSPCQECLTCISVGSKSES